MKFSVGDKVRLTADFLNSTGQLVGGEGSSIWTITECACDLCKSGRYVATDEPQDLDENTKRHMNIHNLEKVGFPKAQIIPQGGFLKLPWKA